MGINWSEECNEVYVAYGQSFKKAVVNLVLLLKYHDYDHNIFDEQQNGNSDRSHRRHRYYIWNKNKKIYLKFGKSNGVWRCWIPL